MFSSTVTLRILVELRTREIGRLQFRALVGLRLAVRLVDAGGTSLVLIPSSAPRIPWMLGLSRRM